MSNVHIQATARTSVLSNSDLLHCIFTFVPAPLPQNLSKRDNFGHLARCTIVCRAFYEPAIRLLWRKLPTLFPLWHLLAPPNAECPPYSFRGDNKRSDYLHQVISAQLYDDPIVWDRFLWHAARVRNIAFRTDKSQAETNAAQLLLIKAVLLRNGGKTILPLLQSIEWDERPPGDGSLIPFFTSTLRDATFSFACPPDEMPHALLLRRLRECSPSLEKLVISTTLWDKDNVAVGPQLLHEVLSFDRLREVKIYSIKGPAAFRDLVAKPGLISLTIWDVTGRWDGPSSQSSSPVLIHDMRRLSVSGTGHSLAGLFKEARFKVLESAKLNVHPDSDSDAAEDTLSVLTAFRDAVPACHLQSLDLFIWGCQSWILAKSFRDVIGPVLHLREMRSFCFGTEEVEPRIEDADIEALVSAWPKLVHLSLDCQTLPPMGSDIHALSVIALHHIHAHCHSIKELNVGDVLCPVVGVQPIPAPLDRSSPHPLRQLSIGRRPIPAFGYRGISEEAAEALAGYLLELFPAAQREGYKRMSDPTSSSYERFFFERYQRGSTSTQRTASCL
ncbi:hypothetical protein V8D89_007495 [Ganoderma adspersum]